MISQITAAALFNSTTAAIGYTTAGVLTALWWSVVVGLRARRKQLLSTRAAEQFNGELSYSTMSLAAREVTRPRDGSPLLLGGAAFACLAQGFNGGTDGAGVWFLAALAFLGAAVIFGNTFNTLDRHRSPSIIRDLLGVSACVAWILTAVLMYHGRHDAPLIACAAVATMASGLLGILPPKR